jgi:hypothetical protein
MRAAGVRQPGGSVEVLELFTDPAEHCAVHGGPR